VVAVKARKGRTVRRVAAFIVDDEVGKMRI